MTTSTSSSRIRHDSDATFREWGLEFSTFLSTIGLVQTADTGQINWTTVTRPGANVEAGYEMWRFNDTQQGTSPIFLRVGYGTNAQTTGPRVQFTVGTGSNGSGTITGTAPFTINNISASSTSETTDTLRNSYFCMVDGAFVWSWKNASNTRSWGMISRTVDSSGVADADGAMVILAGNNALSAACMNFVGTDTITTKRTSVVAAQFCHWPQTPAVSLVGSDQQVACVYGTFPRMRPIPWMVGCIDSEFPEATTFTATMVGSTARTYLSGTNTELFMDANGILKPAMIWE